MRIDKVYIENFKNLNQFTIDIDESKLHTVFLGQNAAGKSNFLEALVIIFRDLDLEDQTDFNYIIEYKCQKNLLKVIGGPNTKGKFQFFSGKLIGEYVKYDTKPISKTLIKKDKDNYLPKHLFSYYSGLSNRLLEHFYKHQLKFADALMDGKNESIRKLFYVRLIHSQFVMMVFFSFSQKKIQDFLYKYLNIIGLESVLFVFKEPNWIRNKNPLDFWGAKGIVREFMQDLWDISMAPIVSKETIKLDFRKTHTQQHLYMYISNVDKLQNLAKKYGSNQEFFKMLESTDVSDLIHEVKVKVKKRNVDGNISFKELSEGEQQLLTVLGLLRFTKEEESLILLDEPDTHLNPLWKWQYMNLLKEIIEESDKSQILMTTHDPLVIGGLTKEEIRVFYSEKELDDSGKEIERIKTLKPEFDPKGLGVAGILTSDFFNLPSTLDPDTQAELNQYRSLQVQNKNRKLTHSENVKLNEYDKYFESLGFNKFTRDPLYNLFLERTANLPELRNVPTNNEERIKQDELALSILENLLKEVKDEDN